MKPTEKHNDEELRIAIAGCEEVVQDYGALPAVYREYIRTVLASLESARADTRRMDWLQAQLHGTFLDLCHYENRSQLDGKEAAEFDPAIPYYIGGQYGHKGSTLRAAIDRAATSAEGVDKAIADWTNTTSSVYELETRLRALARGDGGAK